MPINFSLYNRFWWLKESKAELKSRVKPFDSVRKTAGHVLITEEHQ